jgi:hypothetical protein
VAVRRTFRVDGIGHTLNVDTVHYTR